MLSEDADERDAQPAFALLKPVILLFLYGGFESRLIYPNFNKYFYIFG